MGLYLGIDFGTSTNVVTRWNEDKKRAEPVPLGEHSNAEIFDNVIYYESPQKTIVGKIAVGRAKINPDNGVFTIKRRLEESLDFKQHIPNVGRSLSSVEIAADIFRWIRLNVEEKFGGQKIDGVVISVPFAFQNRECKRIERAAQMAGLNVLGLIEEPVAAAISFGLFEQATQKRSEKILVFDLGGGTFDVTIFEFTKLDNRKFEIKVITTDGEKKLGGVDIDNLIADKMRLKLEENFSDYQLALRPPKEQATENFKMRQIAVEFKEILSFDDYANLFFPCSFDEKFTLDEDIEVDEFKSWLSPFWNKIINALDNALLEANLEKEDIDRIIMVGGTSNIPAIREGVAEYFGKEPEPVQRLTLMVGEGAGIYCGLKYVEKSLDCKISIGVSQNIGIVKGGKFIVMIPRNTLYGTPSEIFEYKIANPGKNKIVVNIFQGNRAHHDKVGSFTISEEIQRQLSTGAVGIRLNTDENNGTIIYEIYDVTGKLLESGKAGES